MKKKIRSRAGFSIIEAVIALTVIVIVTVTAVTVIDMTNRSSGNAMERLECASFVQSLYDAFLVAPDQSAFQLLLNSCRDSFGFTYSIEEGNVYLIQLGNVQYTVTANVREGSFEAVAVNTETDDELYTFRAPEVSTS